MRLNTFENLYADQLNDLYSAETQLIAALPKMADAATTPELKEAFTKHLEETRGHAETLTQLLRAVGERVGDEKCKGMEGLLKEGQEIVEKRGEPAVKDAALIAAAQRCEHYEISGYGTARTFALQLGHNDAVNRLQEILNQESDANQLLTSIATGEGGAVVAINQEAAASHANGSHSSNSSNKSKDTDKNNGDEKSADETKAKKAPKNIDAMQDEDAASTNSSLGAKKPLKPSTTPRETTTQTSQKSSGKR